MSDDEVTPLEEAIDVLRAAGMDEEAVARKRWVLDEAAEYGWPASILCGSARHLVHQARVGGEL